MFVCLFLITLSYASAKAVELYTRDNPNINVTQIPGYFDDQEHLDLNEADFKIAWTFTDFWERETLDSPKYVKQLAWFDHYVNNEVTREYVDFH